MSTEELEKLKARAELAAKQAQDTPSHSGEVNDSGATTEESLPPPQVKTALLESAYDGESATLINDEKPRRFEAADYLPVIRGGGLQKAALWPKPREVATEWPPVNYEKASPRSSQWPEFSELNFSPRVPSIKDPLGLIGTDISRHYQVDSYLDHGGMSYVYRAALTYPYRDGLEYLPRYIAAKLLIPGMAIQNQDLERLFLDEVRKVGKLSHQHIVRILGSGITAGGIPYCLLEWLDGETLEKRMHDGLLMLFEIVNFFRQICSGVKAAHDSRILHLDIKPKNIILVRPEKTQRAEVVKIIDFGIAKIIEKDSGTTMSYFQGTPQFCSPESVSGGKVSVRSDVFSLGILLYQMLSGELPDNFHVHSKRNADSDMELPSLPTTLRKRPKIPVAVDEVIQRATRKKPAERYASAEELCNNFERSLGDALIIEEHSLKYKLRRRFFRH
jgi:serine/threonine protein kinase